MSGVICIGDGAELGTAAMSGADPQSQSDGLIVKTGLLLGGGLLGGGTAKLQTSSGLSDGGGGGGGADIGGGGLPLSATGACAPGL